MKRFIKKILFFDRALLLLSFTILVAIIFTAVSAMYARNFESKNRQLKKQLGEIQSLSGDVLKVKAVVESGEKKLRRKRSAGIVSTLEQILNTLGLEAQVLKPLGKSTVNEFTEENAELELQGTDLNSIVNLLYKIDISPAVMKIKTVTIKSTFEDPDKFIFRLKVSLVSKG
jgi:hypothetical protein